MDCHEKPPSLYVRKGPGLAIKNSSHGAILWFLGYAAHSADNPSAFIDSVLRINQGHRRALCMGKEGLEDLLERGFPICQKWGVMGEGDYGVVQND